MLTRDFGWIFAFSSTYNFTWTTRADACMEPYESITRDLAWMLYNCVWRSVAPVGFLLCSCALLRLRVSGRPWQSTLVRLGSLLRLRSFSAIGLVLSFGSFELRAFFSQRLNCAQFPVDRCLAVFVKSGFVLFLEIFTPSCCTLYIGPQGSGDRSAYCPKSPPSCVLVGDVFERFDNSVHFLRVKNCGASI